MGKKNTAQPCTKRRRVNSGGGPRMAATILRSSISAALLVVGQFGVAESSRSAPQWQPAVPIGKSVRMDIELVPTVTRISAGHQLRLKLISEPGPSFHQYWKTVQIPNSPLPTPEELANLTGGIYTILFGGEEPSVMNLSAASDSDLAASMADWGPKD